jgi:hypothetical protein
MTNPQTWQRPRPWGMPARTGHHWSPPPWTTTTSRTASVSVETDDHLRRAGLSVQSRSLPIWSWKVRTDSVPNSRIAQIKAISRPPRIRMGSGRIRRLMRMSRPE